MRRKEDRQGSEGLWVETGEEHAASSHLGFYG